MWNTVRMRTTLHRDRTRRELLLQIPAFLRYSLTTRTRDGVQPGAACAWHWHQDQSSAVGRELALGPQQIVLLNVLVQLGARTSPDAWLSGALAVASAAQCSDPHPGLGMPCVPAEQRGTASVGVFAGSGDAPLSSC